MRKACFVVNPGGRDGGAAVVMPHDAIDTGIDQLLRNGCSLLRVGLIVFRNKLELHGLAANPELAGIEVFNGKLRATLVVLAVICGRARQWTDDGNFYFVLGES